MNVLAPDEAAELYRMLHHGPTLVVALASALVSLDPSREPPTRRQTRSLESFLAYKATYGLVREDADVPTLFEQFEDWRRSVCCNGPGDPRVLPLHVFDPGPDVPDLDSKAGADRFRRDFGSPSRRLDSSGRVWEKGPAHGGRDILQVAGCELPAGMHWDVSVKRKRCSVANAHEVWRVEGGGYLNVYPDAGLRGPSSIRQDAVRRVWPRGTKNAPPRKRGIS
jgi:hypothetical protein